MIILDGSKCEAKKMENLGIFTKFLVINHFLQHSLLNSDEDPGDFTCYCVIDPEKVARLSLPVGRMKSTGLA